MFGWTGTILRINLTTRRHEKEMYGEELRLHYLGGRGINSRILYQEVGPAIDPLSAGNVLIFGSSPLSGTPAPSTPRCTVTAKSPLTGILGDANFGGFFAPEMKKAGYDHIIIQGMSDKPVSLFITEEGVQFLDATHLWGKTTSETERMIRDELGDRKVQIASAGPAGENLVRIASVVHGSNIGGRTGMGAVMGSKKLKAVAIRGEGKITIAHQRLFQEESARWRDKIRENPMCQYFSTYGGAGSLKQENELGTLPIRNFEHYGPFKGADALSGAGMARFMTGSKTCYSCPVGCIKSYEVKEGLYEGTQCTKMPEGCTSACGPHCGNSSPESLFKLCRLANDYGIDVLDYGTMMAVVMDWYEHGIVGREDTDGIPFNWGNHESMVKMLPRVALREGFGDLLADGAVKAAQKLGKKAEDYVSSCKGMVFCGIDPRVLKGFALCFATATRGADHLRGGPWIELFSRLTPEEAVRRFGTEDVLVPTSYAKAAAANFYQDVYTVADALEVCKFITAKNGHGITLEDMAAMFYAVTGVAMDVSGLREIANRIFTLERAFIIREGITKRDDVLEGKWVRGPVPDGPYKGHTIDVNKWQMMLEEYYQTRGWDARTGIPSRETLGKLGLRDVAEELIKMDRF